MPSLTWSRALTANQQGDNPLAQWQYEYLPWRALVRIYQRATTNGVRQTIFAGSQTMHQKSPVQGGGTAGSTPSMFTTPEISFLAMPGDRLIINNDEVLAGTPTVDGVIYVDPA
jgi:hypothetical protein